VFSLNAEKFRFIVEFIEVRRKALDVFLNRVATHPELLKSEDLKNFLRADEEIWVHSLRPRLWVCNK
jgi:sorting nexin-1/2